MNKTILKVILTAVMFFSFTNAYAVKAKMTTSFNNALNTAVGNSDNLLKVTIQGRDAWKFFYNDSNSQFDIFGVTEEDMGGIISLTSENEYINHNYRQCVGFVKAVTDLGDGSTQNWIKGAAITAYNLPVRGDVIVTFNSNGKYDYRHVAIVLSASNTFIYVIDQNWEKTVSNPDTGRIIIHAIPFNGTGVGDADSYNIVEK
ncbi:MAG: BPSL0067 family protein [Candidatus Gracilibacteria bacterium]|nr:BPSL0067 family protein [Candidatus Gracilibacteria bacterium]